VDKIPDLSIIPEVSDEYSTWFCNDFMYLGKMHSLDSMTLILKKGYPNKENIKLKFVI
jgi:hypothetical protein